MNNIKKLAPTRPDKTIFFVMMGVFFVFFSLPAFYWANYNYGEYSRTADFVQELREKPTANLTPNDKKELDNRISINSSRIELIGGDVCSFLTKGFVPTASEHLRGTKTSAG